MKNKPTLLWVDLTVSVRHGELPTAIRESCDVEICSDAHQLEQTIERSSIDCVCFDLDYPDHGGLNLLRKTKMRFPQLPILLLTLQHSESLAVWAFRSRVLDFLVKPVSHGEFHRCLQTIRYVRKASVNQRSRVQGDNVAPIPPEIPLTMRTDDVRLLPALYYVKQNYRFKIRKRSGVKTVRHESFSFQPVFSRDVRHHVSGLCHALPYSRVLQTAARPEFQCHGCGLRRRLQRRIVFLADISPLYRDDPVKLLFRV